MKFVNTVKSIVALVFILSFSVTVSADNGVIKDGKWEMLEEPMQIGNLGLVFSASVKAEDYKSGPIRDLSFECEYGKTEFTIRFIGENLSENNGEVMYSIDDGPKGKWNMSTKSKSGVFLQSNDEVAASTIRELLGHEKLSLFLKIGNGKTRKLEFDISGIEGRIRPILVLCPI